MLPMSTVLPKTAGQPPPSDRSRMMGRVSLVMTLLSRRVTRTQCFPFLRSRSTLAAFFCSDLSPDDLMTCRWTSSYQIDVGRVSSSDRQLPGPDRGDNEQTYLAHQSDGQPSKGTTAQHERSGHTQVEPEFRIIGWFGIEFMAAQDMVLIAIAIARDEGWSGGDQGNLGGSQKKQFR